MSSSHFTVFAAALLFVGGCAPQPQTPSTVKQDYPGIIKNSADRSARAEREWRRMLDAYKVPQSAPDLYPTIFTPRSLLGVSGGIKLLNVSSGSEPESITLREAVKEFIDRWRDLLGAEPAAISLVNADDSSTLHRYTYRQANYAFPIAGAYGEMSVVVSRDGRLMQLDDRFIPLVEIPSRPQVERDVATRKVIGRALTYSDIAGREQKTQIKGADEVSLKGIVVLPIEKGDAIEVRLAWEVVAGSSLTWTLYIDAITGEELRVVQNFNT